MLYSARPSAKAATPSRTDGARRAYPAPVDEVVVGVGGGVDEALVLGVGVAVPFPNTVAVVTAGKVFTPLITNY